MRAVTLKSGIMAASLETVAEEAGVAKSTAGPAHLLFEHVVDYMFAALVVKHAHTPNGESLALVRRPDF